MFNSVSDMLGCFQHLPGFPRRRNLWVNIKMVNRQGWKYGLGYHLQVDDDLSKRSANVSTVFPSICHEEVGPDAMILVFFSFLFFFILVFWMLSYKPTFSLSSFTFIKRLFSSSSLAAIRVVSSTYLRLLGFLLQSWFQLVLHPASHFTWCTLQIS